ncbi:hypothetical protein [Streptomyces sp. HB132]|uniref:hypothetical protein n=1 Tax=Streptomyces sp. HB132 TaxID=767388 RepID=UPI001EF9247F|nr:hypothetical protein [Streptomyces sp. HB132]
MSMIGLRAALDRALSPSSSQRVRAGRDLAPFAAFPAAAIALPVLLLDTADTEVTRRTAEALARVGTAAAVRLIALALAEADDSHADWMQTGVHDVLAGPDSVPDIAAVCVRLVLDEEAAVREGAREILEWTADATS